MFELWYVWFLFGFFDYFFEQIVFVVVFNVCLYDVVDFDQFGEVFGVEVYLFVNVWCVVFGVFDQVGVGLVVFVVVEFVDNYVYYVVYFFI